MNNEHTKFHRCICKPQNCFKNCNCCTGIHYRYVQFLLNVLVKEIPFSVILLIFFTPLHEVL